MIEHLKEIKPKWLFFGATLLIGVISTVLSSIASPHGDVTLPKDTLIKVTGWVVAIFVGLGAFTIHLWRRDRHSERVKAARERNVPICGCQSEGVIMLRITFPPNPMLDRYECPRCTNFKVIHEH